MIEFNKYIYFRNRGDKKERLRMLLVKSFKVSRVLVSCVVSVFDLIHLAISILRESDNKLSCIRDTKAYFVSFFGLVSVLVGIK